MREEHGTRVERKAEDEWVKEALYFYDKAAVICIFRATVLTV